MTVDREKRLLGHFSCEDLTQSGLAAAGLAHKQHWLFVLKTFSDQDSQAGQLTTQDDFWQVQVW